MFASSNPLSFYSSSRLLIFIEPAWPLSFLLTSPAGSDCLRLAALTQWPSCRTFWKKR